MHDENYDGEMVLLEPEHDLPVKLILTIEWPSIPEWGPTRQPVRAGVPFYLTGSRGKYTITIGDDDE